MALRVQKKSYSCIFLSIFLWLGLWFKLAFSLFLLGIFSFGEPVGNFNSSPQSWDMVLNVASIGALGFIFAIAIISQGKFNDYYAQKLPQSPKWYPRHRRMLWMALLVFIVVIACANVVFGVHQVGIVPKTIFHWPINALVAWCINIGTALAISVMMAWDISAEKKLTLSVGTMFIEALFNSVSLISRAHYIWHTAPQIFSLNQLDNKLKENHRGKAFLLMAIFSLLFILSVYSVSKLRDHQYIDTLATATSPPICNINDLPSAITGFGMQYVEHFCPKPNKYLFSQEKKSASALPPRSFRMLLIYQIFVNRWIGLEGIMAVSSYSHQGVDLLIAGVLEGRKNGSVDLYQKISQSGYQIPDLNYQFSTLPGIIAFAFYSGSLVLVFVTVLLFTCVAFIFERVVFTLTKNPIYCSIVGALIASGIAQFGIAPLQDAKMYLMLLAFSLVICGLQSAVKK